jgi:lysophospholipid acyltransferase (LPLAT)-like uncharacterized protein
VVSFLGYLYLSFVALTSRIRVTSSSPDSIRSLREGRAVVYAFWFEHVLFLLYYFGARRMPMLMTPKAKTDRITRLSGLMGLKVAIGSLEGGGRHALVTLLEQLKAGQAVAIPADGSRGPAHKCKAGCFILAQESAVPIVPVNWRAWLTIRVPRKHVKLYVPLPFNSIEIRLGAPLAVNKHYQFNELESVKLQLAGQLDRLME